MPHNKEIDRVKNISDLLVDTKTAWIDFPGFKGFEVEVAILSRPELTKLRKSCVQSKFNRSSRNAEETLDEEKFVSRFSRATVKNWKGLTLEIMDALVLIDMGDFQPDELVEFSPDNAETLVTHSSEFDQWLNEVVFDLDNFRNRSEG